jgi:PAS domain S-box-containing protein
VNLTESASRPSAAPSVPLGIGALAPVISLLPLPIVVIATDEPGTIVLANDAAYAAFEAPRNGGVVLRAIDFYASPADRGQIVERLKRDNLVDDLEIEYRTYNGRRFWARASARLFECEGRTLTLVALQDITQRKNSERTIAELLAQIRKVNADLELRIAARTNALEHATTILQSTFDSMDQGVGVFDKELRLTACNHRWNKLLALPEHLTRPGESKLADMLAFRAQRGDYGNISADEVIRARTRQIAAGAYRYERRLQDGAWLQVAGNPLPDGASVITLTDVTSLKRAELELRVARDEAGRVRQQLTQAIESISEGFVLYDADDRLVLFNSRYRDEYSFSPDMLVAGTRFEEIVRSGVTRGFVPAGYDPEQWVQDRLNRHRNPGAPYVVQRRDGRWTMMREYRTHEGGIVGIRTDVTDLKRREQELADSQRLLRAVIDAVPAIINVKDRQSRYLLMNRFQGEVYGIDPEAAIGKTSEEIVDPDYGSHSMAQDQRVVETGEPLPFSEREFTDAQGGHRTWFTAKLPLKDAAGAVQNVVTVALDISKLKSTERARHNLARYFAPNMVEMLAQTSEPFGPARSQDVVVMFVDIVGFTQLCETRPATEVFDLLREFQRRLTHEVFVYGGTLDKYIGDGVMVTFGTPLPGPLDATNALRCTRGILRMIATWNRERLAAGTYVVHVAIGVHQGPALLGNIGDEQRLDFAVIGDTVNVASRLEKLARPLDAAIVASTAVLDAAAREGDNGMREREGFIATGPQYLRGRDAPVDVWILRQAQV